MNTISSPRRLERLRPSKLVIEARQQAPPPPPPPPPPPLLTIDTQNTTTKNINTSMSPPPPPPLSDSSREKFADFPKVSPKILIPKIEEEASTPRSRVYYMEPATPNCGRLANMTSVEEALEGGMCRSYLAEECSGPSPKTQRAWEQCQMIVDRAKRVFRLFVASKSQRFLLSAYCDKNRNTFYISQYQDYPDVATKSEEERDAHACCVLQRVGNSADWELWYRGCVFCDQVVGKYTCENEVVIDDEDTDDGKSVLKTLMRRSSGSLSPRSSAKLRKQQVEDQKVSVSNGGHNTRIGRQLLGEIVHRSVRVQCGKKSTDTVFTRCLRMFIPVRSNHMTHPNSLYTHKLTH